jgi:hypothetical protein
MGLFDRAASLSAFDPVKYSPVMGLLRKTKEIITQRLRIKEDQTAKELPVEEEPHISSLYQLLSSITSLSGGIESVAELFSLVRDFFKLSKSAFLLYDPLRMVFSPWASAGLDQTTLHRLRIPLGFNKNFNRVANGEVLIFKESGQIKEFNPFFSARENSAIKQLVFVPFIADSKLIAILLIIKMEGIIDPETPGILKEVSLAAAPHIYQAREKKLGYLSGDGKTATFESLQSRVDELIDKCSKRNMSLALIKISIEHMVNTILKYNEFIDPFRLKEDLYRITGSLLADIGEVFRLDSNNLILLISEMQITDPALLLHQLAISLGTFFEILKAEHSMGFDEKIIVYPEDGDSSKKLLSHLK